MQEINSIFYIVVLIMSIVVHEVAHGYAAYYMGDMTAKNAGRLTLNPLKHLDIFGSVILPLILLITKAGFIFGWAKPVPYNEGNLRDKKWGTVLVASAGVFVNLFIALCFGLIVRTGLLTQTDPAFPIVVGIILINTLLAVFNLIPIPPLDGSRILFAFLPVRFREFQNTLEKYSLFILIFFILFLWQFISPLVFHVFSLFTGLPL